MSAFVHFGGLLSPDTNHLSFQPEEQSRAIDFYRFTEVMISMCVIALLCAIALNIFSMYKKQAILMHCLAFDNMREEVHVYHSLTGEWPASEDDFEDVTGMPYQINGDDDHYIESARLDRGAVSYAFKKDLEGDVVTIRPAVSGQAPLGPVIWVVGKEGRHEGWTIVGDDKSTVDPWVINRYLR